MSKNIYILFWSTYNPITDITLEDWLNRKINISPFHFLTLHSHIKQNNKTILYSYQKFNDNQIPKGITIADASQYFPSKVAFKSLKDGHSIAHISDAVRLKSASEKLGIVLDMDAVILKQLPEEKGWFASMPAKMTGGFAPKWGKSHPPLYISDKNWDGKALGAFPIKVSKSISKHIMSLSHKIMITLMEKPKTNSNAWNYVIWTIKKIMSIDNTLKVYKPISFCPLPAWLHKGKCYSLESPTRLNGNTELFGYKLPAIKDIFNNSFVIQHFFESAFQKAHKVNPRFWELLADDSLLAMECEFVFGNNWRDCLINKTLSIEK